MALPLRSPRFNSGAVASRFRDAAQNAPTIKRNEANRTAVRLLQQALIDAGFPLPESVRKYGSPDGLFGNETDTIVRLFQKKHFPDRVPDGKVGKDTLSKLDDLLPRAGAPLPPLAEVADEDFDELGRNAVLDVLNGPHISGVRFTFRGQDFRSTSFQGVADLLESGRVNVMYDPIVGDTGLAVYNPANAAGSSANTIVVPKIQLVTWKQRSVLLHECIHVIQDIRAVPMTRAESESAAFIGQNLYHRLATGNRVTDSSPRANAIHIAADTIVTHLLSSNVPSESDISALENAILNAGYPAEMVSFDGLNP